jgi:simple sugar transport system ATP-binding protein
VSKRFGSVQALERVSLDFHAGEIHALLGENGAGKSTLMHVLNGMLRPDSGSVWLDGKPVRFRSARAAQRAGIGMVHQHFTLVDALTVGENLALSLPGQRGWAYRADDVAREAEALAQRVGLQLAPTDQVVGTLPVGARQRLEILKALAGGSRILILDEPTAVLTPHEVAPLFEMLSALRQQNRAIIFITHKLREAKQLSDRISVLRSGHLIGTWASADVTESELARQLLGERDDAADPAETRTAGLAKSSAALTVAGLRSHGRGSVMSLEDIHFEVGTGEIFGIAGVDGNGQRELFDVLVGTRTPAAGRVVVHGEVLSRFSPAAMLAAGVGHIPPDRHHEGLVLDMSVADNLVLSRVLLDRFSNRSLLDVAEARKFAEELVRQFDVRCASIDVPVRSLSGGNQQRVVVARELAPGPRVLVTVNPTRGLDIAAGAAVERALRAIAAAGCGIVLISTDLDEILELADRVAVLSRGRLGVPLERPFDLEQVGLQMAGAAAPAAER